MQITLESNPEDILLGFQYMDGKDEDENENAYGVFSIGLIFFIINFVWLR